MLKFGRRAIRRAQLGKRVQLIDGYLPTAQLPCQMYDVIISNSLLHHLQDPQVLWESVKRFARPTAPVFVMDLMRPQSKAGAEKLTRDYAGDEPEILKHDFFHSLLAAYRADEIQSQLERARLNHFSVEVVSDRHLVVWGRVA